VGCREISGKEGGVGSDLNRLALARSKIDDEDEDDYSEGDQCEGGGWRKEASNVASSFNRLIVTRALVLVPFRTIVLVLVIDF